MNRYKFHDLDAESRRRVQAGDGRETSSPVSSVGESSSRQRLSCVMGWKKTMIETKKNFGPWTREPAQGASLYIPKFEISLVSTFPEKVGEGVDPRYGYGIL